MNLTKIHLLGDICGHLPFGRHLLSLIELLSNDLLHAPAGSVTWKGERRKAKGESCGSVIFLFFTFAFQL